MTSELKIGLLGFGEVGQILGQDLSMRTGDLVTYDIAFGALDSPLANLAAQSGVVEPKSTAAELSQGCNLILCAVTAEQAEQAARSVQESLRPGTWYVDLNSSAPATKRRAAETIGQAGGLYVEAAVMSPVPPKRLSTPILLGGPHAEAFQPLGHSLGLTNLKVFSEDYGRASAAKMCRSVMIKGIEALLTESLVTARAHGVEETVLTSLDDLFPGPDWKHLAQYMIERSLEHGGRRAEEMREVAKTVADIGLQPSMSLATAARQDWAKAYPDIERLATLDEILDALCDVVRPTAKSVDA